MENLGDRVAVVGAGYAGMAAAVTLAKRGVPVTVFEANTVPGGRARRIISQGRELDNGQHILIGAYSELFRLMREVGVPSDALLRLPLEIRYPGRFAFRARPLPAPLGLLGGFLLARGIPMRERFSAIRFLNEMRKRQFEVDPDRSVDELLRAHGEERRVAHYVWRPLCVSALNTPTAQASARRFLAVIRDTLFGPAEASDLLLPRVDLSRLFPEPAARFVQARGGEMRLGEPVRDLGALRARFRKIIVAVGPHHVKTLAPGIVPEYSYQPIYTCYLQYPENVKLGFPMLGLADGLVQWVFDRGVLLGEKGRLACVISAQGDHQQMSQEELAERCQQELVRAIGDLPPPQWSRVIAEKRATPSCTPDFQQVDIETSMPGVYLAGDYADPEYPPTLEAAVRSGVRAAARITL